MSRGNVENLLKVPELEAFLKKQVVGNKELFIGIRGESITLYYWGKSMLELAYVPDHKCSIKIHKKYIDQTAFCGLKFTEKSDYMIFSFSDEFIQAFSASYPVLKANMEKQIDEGASIDEKAGSLGQKYQGIIACNNNSSQDSDWYCIDLDYAPEGTPFGRLDLVAVSKEPYQDKYRMVLVELKYSWQAYKSGYRKNLYNNKKNKGYYIEANALKTRKNATGDQKRRRFGCKYDEKKKQVVAYEFGSGITADFYNYSQFLFAENGKYPHELKEACYDILSTKQKLGCFETNDQLGDDLLKLLASGKEAFTEALEDTLECVFLTIGCNPLDKCQQTMIDYLSAGTANIPDVLSCTKEHWTLRHNNGKGKIQTIEQGISLADAFPEAFEERVRYLFTRKESLENLNIIDHLDAASDDELIHRIFS